MSYAVRPMAAVVFAALVTVSCADKATAPELASSESAKSASGAGTTTLYVSKTATGYNERVSEYDWTLEKKVSEILGADMFPESSVSATDLPVGQVKWVMYDFIAKRTLQSQRDETGVRGSICVANTGDSPTQGLAISDVVQLEPGSGTFNELRRATVDLGDKTVLAPGEEHCYSYATPFAGTPGAAYRALAQVTVTNYAQHSGSAFGPTGLATTPEFRVPSNRVASTRDAEAVLREGISQTCANIFPSVVCTGAEGFRDMVLSDSKTFTHPKTVDGYNFHVCGERLPFTNVATLTELGPYDTGELPQSHAASATLIFDTGACAPKPTNPGCTLTQGYWKNHAWPLHPIWPPSTLATWPDILGWKFFDTNMEWPDILNVEPNGDAYFILAHQYIAAILNQQSGAYVPEAVRQALVSSYEFFSSSAEARAVVDRDVVLQWKDVLDAYNNGLSGVPHCD